MKKLTHEELQGSLFEILCAFDGFCRRNHLRYYLCGGTLLGAVRHHGFIPWDDDIDVCMPRPDYEKLRMLAGADRKISERYTLQTDFLGAEYPFFKVLDEQIRVNNRRYEDADRLWIDVLPVDGLPQDQAETERIYRKEDRLRHMIYMHTVKFTKGSGVLVKALKKTGKKIICFFFSVPRLSRMMIHEALKIPYETSEYVGIVTWGLYGAGEKMKKKEFEESTDVLFCGRKFPAMSCWDSYLHGLYHDYMQLPAEEDRETHTLDAWKE